MSLDAATVDALRILRRNLPAAAQHLQMEADPATAAWIQVLDLKLLPRLQADAPLIAAICGGGSAGKSTLFNALVGRALSPAGGRAGLNRRVLAAVNETLQRDPAFFAFLQHALGGELQPMEQTGQLLEPGAPLYWSDPDLPGHLVLLDTPDIDTGARGEYTNRRQARQSLEAADLFVYIFTNATYNNRDNTDFMAGLLNAVGSRPCFLVYRVYPSFSREDVLAHAATVARNIYGSADSKEVLGIFRADEDNAVAAGTGPLRVQAVTPGPGDLQAALAGVRAADLRERMLASMLRQSLAQAETMQAGLVQSKARLADYKKALSAAQAGSVRQALSHFPTDAVLGRFGNIWLQSDPAHIKLMRRTGRVVEWPYLMLRKVVKHLGADEKPRIQSDRHPVPSEKLAGQFEMDLLQAANSLYQWVLDDTVRGDGQGGVHPVVRPVQADLRTRDWKRTLVRILAEKESILSWSQSLEGELKTMAATLRARMGLWGQVRQTFGALLNVIPATAAITYVLHTGDPVGAAGLKVKLTGLFGLNDLYALIAIPATAGLKKADRRQLEQMLQPVAKAWLEHKLMTVQQVFETHLTGELLAAVDSAQSATDALVDACEKALAACRRDLAMGEAGK